MVWFICFYLQYQLDCYTSIKAFKFMMNKSMYTGWSSNPFFIQFTLFDLTLLAHLAQSKEGMVLSRAHTMNLRRTAGAQCILALGANIGRLTNVQVSSCKQNWCPSWWEKFLTWISHNVVDSSALSLLKEVQCTIAFGLKWWVISMKKPEMIRATEKFRVQL